MTASSCGRHLPDVFFAGDCSSAGPKRRHAIPASRLSNAIHCSKLTVFFGKPNVPFVIWFTYTWLDDAQERGFVTSDAPALILERRGGYKCDD
jgi:hypothetical protein